MDNQNQYEVIVPETVRKLLPGAFRNQKEIHMVRITGNTAVIGESAFEGCTGLEKLTLEDGVRSICPSAFAGCVRLKEVLAPDSVAGIQDGAFRGCVCLEKVRLPKGLRYMDRGIFEGCSALTSIRIPAEVKVVSAGVFKNCTSLREVVFEGEETKCYQEAFEGCYQLSTESAAAIAERFLSPLSFRVRAGEEGFAGRMSTFTPRNFTLDGVPCASMESALQSFRFEDPEEQAEICGMQAQDARNAESWANWKETGTLYWQDAEYPRESQEYQALLDRLFMSVYEQDDTFRVDVTLCRGAEIRLRHWSRNPMAALLTQQEYLSRLECLSKLQPGEALHTAAGQMEATVPVGKESRREQEEESLPPVVLSMALPEPGKRNIVVMGGSFNPPTLAHLRLMRAAVDAVGAEKGIFVPSNDAYVRNKMRRQRLEQETLSEETRLSMLEAMCGEDSRLTADPCEYGREEKAKTFETMENIQKKYPNAVLYFVAGGDKLPVIPRWHRNEEFLDQFRILVIKRDGSAPEEIVGGNPLLRRHAQAFVLLREPEGLEGISSTRVRNLLRSGDETAAQLVHPGVWEILKEKGMLKMDITSFRGDYDFLSNFYETTIEYKGLHYQNAEAAFQAQKCLLEEDKEQFCGLAANKAKKLGRQVPLRPDWEEVKVEKMTGIVRAKFMQNPELAEKLLATGERALVEGNSWHDVFWGVDSATGQGENHLGKILMQVRRELRGEN